MKCCLLIVPLSEKSHHKETWKRSLGWGQGKGVPEGGRVGSGGDAGWLAVTGSQGPGDARGW